MINENVLKSQTCVKAACWWMILLNALLTNAITVLGILTIKTVTNV